MSQASQIVERYAKRVRDAVADFQLEHSIHPTALMVGAVAVDEIVAATRALHPDPEKAAKKGYLGTCPVCTQTTFLGFPIITSRPDRAIAPVLLDLNFLKP